MLTALFLLLVNAAPTTAIPLPPRPAHYVTDNAGVLPPERTELLNKKLADFERTTSNQVLVYIDHDLPKGTTLEEMSAQAIRQWGVGQKGKDNGVVLFLFTDARKMRIEVGYGLEATLTDAQCKRITSEVIKPLLLQHNYPDAVDHGVDAILAVAKGENFRGTGKTVNETRNDAPAWFIVIFVVMLIAVPVIVILSIIKIVRSLARRSGGGTSTSSYSGNSYSSSTYDSSSSSSSSSDSSSFDSSSSSSDSFSGGGGDSGGGGASDSW